MFRLRLKVFLVVMALGVGVLVARLADLQLLQGDEKKEESGQALTRIDFPATVRGQIRDRNGVVLACDVASFDFCLDYRMLVVDNDSPLERRSWAGQQVCRLASDGKFANPEAQEEFRRRMENTWALAEEITHTTRNEMARTAETVVRRVKAIHKIVDPTDSGKIVLTEEMQAHPIITGLDEAVAVELRSRLGEMMGASVQPSHRRWYPAGEVGCHLVGLLGQVGVHETLPRRRADLPVEDVLNGYNEGDLIGRTGAERLCEEMLRGQRGYREIHRSGEVLKEIPPRMGQDVHLTIDVNLQRDIASLPGLQGRSGAVVVLDVASNEVIAAVSLPTYDLNQYRQQYETLASDQADYPLLNKALGVRYPPGSTCKPLVAVAALSSGTISSTTVFCCRGYLSKPDEFRCDGIHGDVAVTEALRKSCNVFFYNVGERMHVATLSDWLGRFGYAEEPGTGMPEELRGVLPDPRVVQGAGESRFLAIGQGVIGVTPLHVANAMATIARGGEFRTPVIVKELADLQRRRNLHATAAAAATVREGMRQVVNEPGGTAYSWVRDDEIEICGKTGTAQTEPRWVDLNGNRRKDEGEILRSGDTAWFVGFAPFHNPQVAFAVMVEYSSEHGAVVCGPVARDVMHLCKDYGYIR